MGNLKKIADRITLETGKVVPNPKIVLLTIDNREAKGLVWETRF